MPLCKWIQGDRLYNCGYRTLAPASLKIIRNAKGRMTTEKQVTDFISFIDKFTMYI